MIVNPKAIGIEREWFPFTKSQRDELRRQLIDQGHTRTVIAGIVEFVAAQAAGDVSAFSGPTRARYRRTLAGLAGLDPDGDQRPGLPLGWSDRQAGFASVRSSGLVGAGAMLALVAAAGGPTAAAVLAAPIIFVM